MKEENRIRRKEARIAANRIQELEERVHELVMYLTCTVKLVLILSRCRKIGYGPWASGLIQT